MFLRFFDNFFQSTHFVKSMVWKGTSASLLDRGRVPLAGASLVGSSDGIPESGWFQIRINLMSLKICFREIFVDPDEP